ncbi:hypothetical protein LXL04_013519 [Taraxacum kok-saghyz]
MCYKGSYKKIQKNFVFLSGCLCAVLRTADGWAIEIGTVNAQNVFRNNASHARELTIAQRQRLNGEEEIDIRV